MPTPATSSLPKPKSWDEFEDIVWEIHIRQWQDPRAQRYGRSGQRQNGVDIYGQQDSSGSYIAVQCKRYDDGKLNCKEIEEEISKAESFSSVISEYIIATTESRDTKIQDCIRCLDEQRQSEGKFRVYVVFWEDLCARFSDPNNHDLLRKYYSGWEKIFKASAFNIDWYEISQRRLEAQQRLTTSFLTRKAGVIHHLQSVYVPLGMEEHKKLSKRQADVAPQEGSTLYRETETTQTFEHEQFLEQVFRQQRSPNSQSWRIAIIGEPGAGKTTLLQQLTQWIVKELGQTVIWVSLSALEGQSLEEYLLKRWVKDGLQVASVSPEQENAFVEWFKDSQIWLLLDGADEIPSGTQAAPLQAIVDQITGWVGQARIVLTCRQNLWGNCVRSVEEFDTYRTLEFSYPTQVEQFVENWFAPLPERGTTQGHGLCAALRERGRERIQDLVKNPLLLTLLCLDWHIREGKLPETRAELYGQFVEDFYDWKQNEFPTKTQQRQQLNAKLSELAREATTKEVNRFCLRQEFIYQFMGEPEDEGSLFCLALKLGWLNKVGVDVNNPRRSVYAFLHPTFEEYFAALEIVQRFEKYRNLTFKQLRDEIFEQHWQDKTWHEILRLICGMIDARFAEVLIEFLMTREVNRTTCLKEQDPLWEKHYGKLLKPEGIVNLLLAYDCFLEINGQATNPLLEKQLLETMEHEIQNSEIQLSADAAYELFERIARTYPNKISWIKRFTQSSRDPLRSAAIWAIARNCHANLGTLSWLQEQAENGRGWVTQSIAITAIAHYFHDEPGILNWLKMLAEFNQSHLVRSATIETLTYYFNDEISLLNWLKERAEQDIDRFVRAACISYVIKSSRDGSHLFTWLSQLAQQHAHIHTRWTSVRTIVEVFHKDEKIFELLCGVTVNDPFILPQTDWQPNPRQEALNALLTHYSTHPKTLELLHDRAINDLDEQLRLWARQQLQQWEKTE